MTEIRRERDSRTKKPPESVRFRRGTRLAPPVPALIQEVERIV
jgi:hypothetical protein